MVHTDGMLHAVDSTWLCLSLNKQLHVDEQETADEQVDKFEKKRAKQLERDAVEARRANKRAAKKAKLDEQQKVQEKNKAEAEAGVQQDTEYAAFQAAAQPPQQQGKTSVSVASRGASRTKASRTNTTNSSRSTNRSRSRASERPSVGGKRRCSRMSLLPPQQLQRRLRNRQQLPSQTKLKLPQMQGRRRQRLACISCWSAKRNPASLGISVFRMRTSPGSASALAVDHRNSKALKTESIFGARMH